MTTIPEKSNTMFYAWQSDRPNKTNRSFIQQALQSAVKALAEDAEIEDCPEVDQDTAGEPGTPSIADTIFAKIDSCPV